jgi:hypothetical protein
MTKPVLGYLEVLTLPEVGIQCHAKVDTGACSSSLHAEDIKVFQRDGQDWVSFHVLFSREKMRIDQRCEAPLFTRKRIASSNGSRSYRYVIKTPVTIGNQQWPIELSLTPRGSMKYPMLLGREAISGRFIVDVEHTYLST